MFITIDSEIEINQPSLYFASLILHFWVSPLKVVLSLGKNVNFYHTLKTKKNKKLGKGIRINNSIKGIFVGVFLKYNKHF